VSESGVSSLDVANTVIAAAGFGPSLVNGTEPMQALLAFWVHDAVMLVQVAALCHR
jgi:hypothetical protein